MVKVKTTITIDAEKRAELKKRGIPIGSAAANWLDQVMTKKHENEELNEANERIKTLETNMKKYQEIVRQSEEESNKPCKHCAKYPTDPLTTQEAIQTAKTEDEDL